MAVRTFLGLLLTIVITTQFDSIHVGCTMHMPLKPRPEAQQHQGERRIDTEAWVTERGSQRDEGEIGSASVGGWETEKEIQLMASRTWKEFPRWVKKE
jgi:2-succinyl-5-enolpyruvyl-6-hydroxy-3-cyclohexene-1-carboxylate synthase